MPQQKDYTCLGSKDHQCIRNGSQSVSIFIDSASFDIESADYNLFKQSAFVIKVIATVRGRWFQSPWSLLKFNSIAFSWMGGYEITNENSNIITVLELI